MSSIPLHIGFDAKRIVRNGTGLGAYGRTLVNDLSHLPLQLSLYAPDKGHEKWRTQVLSAANVHFCYPDTPAFPCLRKMSGALWRSHGIVNDLKRDNIQLYHGLSGELPIGIRKSGIPSVVTIHDLIFLRHPEFYHPLDVQIYKWKFHRTLREASHIIAISECTKRDIIDIIIFYNINYYPIYEDNIWQPRLLALTYHLLHHVAAFPGPTRLSYQGRAA